MPRKKKIMEESISTDQQIPEEISPVSSDLPVSEESPSNPSDTLPDPNKNGENEPESPFVTVNDVIKNKDDGPLTIKTMTDPNTKLSKITIFEGVEDADDPMTYRIPEDQPVILKDRGDFSDHPDTFDLMAWQPSPDQQYFIEKDGMIVANYLTHYFKVPEDRQGLLYIIAKKHYKERIPDLLQHINYFVYAYDYDKEYLVATLSIKNYIDRHPTMPQKAFARMVLTRLVTPSMVNKIKRMAFDLYKLNINTDRDGKYKTTPKISNDHARMIVAVSFCIRLLLPICIHFSNTNATFINKRDYIDCFDRIFMQVIDRFEKDDIQIWNPICRFVAYRVDRTYNSDIVIWQKKKQLYGTTVELYLESLIHEVILVKSLHKLAYNRSIVSFIDGIITHSYTHYRYENFKYKPVEIEDEDSDSDDYLSHQETMEMQISRVDESNQLINETNTKQVMEEIKARFRVDIPQEEFDFYFENMRFNSLTQSLLHAFFSKYFNDTNAIRLLDKRNAVELAVYMKKFLQLRGMIILPQICTAKVRGKFKDTCIKNAKFLERFTTSSVYQHIISEKYRYIKELGLKEDPIVKMLSTMLNSSFEFVDTDPEVNGRICDNINADMMVNELMLFLSIC